MTACHACGGLNPDHARFCQSCGSPLQAETDGESRRTVTVVFSDLVGSTALGERLDTESLTRLLNRYFERMRAITERHGGMVAKFIGDAVVAVFGLPVLHEDDALRALRAAVEMSSALGALNEEFEARWGVTLSARTGVNTGTVLVETGAARSHIAVGDAMNLGARLEQAAEPGEIVLGEATYLLVRGMVEVESIEPLTLKGKSQPVRAYRLHAVDPGAESLPRRLDSPMVGRHDDLSTLEWAFERTVRDSACRVVTITGAAGVGKSRLVREFLRGVDGGATVLRGRCLPYGEGITFWPLVEVVRQAAGIADSDTAEQATEKLAAVLARSEEPAEVAARVAEVVGLSAAAGTAKEAFWSVRKLFEALASAQPLIVVFDDLHWAEPTFLDLIEDVATWTRGVSILLLCTARPELLDAHPNWNEPQPFKTMHVALSPLGEADADRLLGNLLGPVELSPGGREAIVEASGGNPLFVEQMLSMLADDGAALTSRTGSSSSTAHAVELSAPPTIQALLVARLDRLVNAERQVLERASVVGKVFYTDAVADLGPDDEQPATGLYLTSLTRKQLVAPSSSDLAGQDAFRFVHGLVRDAAYEGITKERRASLHEQFADWLESSVGDRLREYEEILAYHLEQASRYRAELGTLDAHGHAVASRAADRLRSAATRALARGDLPAAINLASRAMSLLHPTDERQPELLIMVATSLGEQGHFESEKQTLDKALAIASTLQDERLLAHVTLAQARARAFVDATVSMEEADREAGKAIEVFERVGDDLGLAKAWRFRNWVAHNSYQHAEAEAASAKAYEFAHRAGDPSQVGDLSVMSASILYGPTPVREGIRKCEAILGRVEGSRGDVGFVIGFLGILHAMDGRPDEGRALIERAAAIAEDLGPSLTSAATRSYWMGVLDILTGDLPEAERELRRGYEILDEMGETNFRSTLSARLAQVLCALERYEEAERYAQISRDTSGLDDVASQVLWRGAQAKVLARRGDLEGAEALAAEAVALASHTDALNLRADARMDLAAVLGIAKREDDAADAVQDALALYEEKGNVVMARVARNSMQDPAC